MALTPAQWDEMSQLGKACLRLPEEERAAFLAEACAQNADLRQIVHLLHNDGPGTEDSGNLLPLGPGRSIGPYRIERELGRGGMGAVFLASREDTGMQVALEVLRRGLDDEGLRALLLGAMHSRQPRAQPYRAAL